jgi:FkbM family methyltransferase
MISIKQTIRLLFAMAAMPLLQAIVRNTPPSRLRLLVWRLGRSPLFSSVDFVTKANGFDVAGNTNDLIQGYLYWFGVWEPNLTDFIMRRMSEAPKRVFVDVGANIGYFTILVATRYPQSSVVSIEAFPPTVEKLRFNLERNCVKNVRMIDVAVSGAEGVVEFFYAGCFNEGATTTVKGRFQSTALPVSCKPLSKLLSDDEMAAARLIKIDVEGAELSVINGMVSILPLLPEDCEVIVEISGDSVEGSAFIFDAFAVHGFHAYELENDYNPLSYLYPQAPRRPQRLSAIPKKQTDVVFSRLDIESL